ncbi:L,D-transpeptidase family protein [Thalassotalea mangrovi]|uniref:LysM peptidoglycan-binding domain-containing protein n=1 Tax=Thalassotalea mangrovi TaxID=2572245 RepID=A0A4U1B8V8_9GAMM|nr:L,D-transpeptidase family protein [Thalassotalea mangrovi]TKB47053.1 LysM peptidoglycan-binding domain-containing protein [Thalassotalea mangrovi]
MKNAVLFLVSLILIVLSSASNAKEYTLTPDNGRLIGSITYHTVEKGDYFQKIAEQYDIGFLALMESNPGVDPTRLKPGMVLTIPSQMILPYAKREGIVVNLSELRLYYFPEESNKVHVFPVGIGKIGDSTPTLISHISEKRHKPDWYPTDDKREEYQQQHGTPMPKVIPAGPENPLGDHALRLGQSVYLIHGTNQRFGIGMRVSSGCIRMYPKDIEWLFNEIDIGTKVTIIDQPIKMTYQEPNTRLIEVHSPLSLENHQQPSLLPFSDGVKNFLGNDPDLLGLLEEYVKSPKGIPMQISPGSYANEQDNSQVSEAGSL